MNNKVDETWAENFVTVVSVGNKNDTATAEDTKDKEFVTVLRIGEENVDVDYITEEVLVYRLPGERLGFGLKFEGGTKATEYVKKLFIQSCAPDSPASKVIGSWGHLTEGDEVLVIDSRPVTSMTRMDCVKCLKDSSVVIKLLVRHQREETKYKPDEGLPLVVSAEKKKPPALPPTPPPVPPRKVPRKHLRVNLTARDADILPHSRLKNFEGSNIVKANSPEVRTRKLIDSGPPEAECYVDLFSQESIHSLSESDDTASTISTVIDRNANSLPSTPKSIQKHLDIANFPDDEELFNINSTNTEEKFEFTTPDQQDAGDVEDKVEIQADSTDEVDGDSNSFDSIEDLKRDLLFQAHDENMNIFSLPRLVDFVPKSFNDIDHKRMMNLFLSFERGEHLDFKFTIPEDALTRTSFNDDMDIFPKWSIPPQLSTIGEVEEEENLPTRFIAPNPIVLVQCEGENETEKDDLKNADAEPEIENQIMEPPPSDRRQPPDGHEFPDFEESFQNRSNDTLLQRLKTKYSQVQEYPSESIQKSPFEVHPGESFGLNKMTSISNTDLSTRSTSQDQDTSENSNKTTDNSSGFSFYTRSQSLCDISMGSRQNDPLQNLVEQRRKNLSKLKGLVIPDSISECDLSSTINLPEIKSSTSVSIEDFNSLDCSEVPNETTQVSSVNSTTLTPIAPAWAATVNFPKYSPAFKRKDLQLYPSSTKMDPETCHSKMYTPLELKKPQPDNFSIMKSVDSSPTRSENSFNVIQKNTISKTKPRPFRSFSMETNFLSKRENITDDESDNDSALSSSQSSFVTTSPSPTTSVENYVNTLKTDLSEYSTSDGRHIKSSSVEALNRKNILASAKCRSGKDFKIGSPVVNRKLEVPDDKTENVSKLTNVNNIEKVETHVVIEEKVKKPLTRVLETQKIAVKETNRVPNLSSKLKIVPPRTNLRNWDLQTSTRSSLTSSKDNTSSFRNALKPVPIVSRREERISKFSSTKSLSVTDLRKNFEEIAKTVAEVPKYSTKKLDLFPKVAKSVPSSPDAQSDKNVVPKIKQISSVGNESVSKVEETRKKTCKVILKPNVVGENIGITITGGTDENKDIIVHRIRYGSVAYQDGTLTKGDHIVSINGKDTKGLSYTDAVQLLKAVVETFVIEIAVKDEVPKDVKMLKRRSISLDNTLDTERAAQIIVMSKKPNHEIILQKDQNGLGFSVEGGKDSPQGDVPITVKKIFQGGVADKDGRLKDGDEILSINGIDFSNLSRIQAWTIMKKVDVGTTKIMIYRK
ncbi:uncharacterized protein LOC123686121 isoform X2 [Harmonia axyridis]|nr:uncharacterized protein LOC123686121 isoform X2 [Harmonia axyridis]